MDENEKKIKELEKQLSKFKRMIVAPKTTALIVCRRLQKFISAKSCVEIPDMPLLSELLSYLADVKNIESHLESSRFE